MHPGNEVATTALHALLGIGTGPAWPPFEPLAAPGLAPVAPGLAPVALQPMVALQEAEAQPMKAEPREEGQEMSHQSFKQFIALKMAETIQVRIFFGKLPRSNQRYIKFLSKSKQAQRSHKVAPFG